MVAAEDLIAVWITVKLAAVTTVVLLALGMPLAWWLAHSRSRLCTVIEAIVALPLVLPPTVLGFYLLLLLGAHGPLSTITGLQPLAFSFAGLVIGSVIYSTPFVVQPLRDAFVRVGKRPLEVAATLRASPLNGFLTVALPMARPGILTAAILGFAHTLGEFGVVLMIGGNIPGTTRVLSVAIYDHVETLNYDRAHLLSAGLLVTSFVMLMVVYRLNKRFGMVRP